MCIRDSINPVPAPVVEEAHGAGSAVVTIFQCEGGHAACDARVVVYIRIVGLDVYKRQEYHLYRCLANTVFVRTPPLREFQFRGMLASPLDVYKRQNLNIPTSRVLSFFIQ